MRCDNENQIQRNMRKLFLTLCLFVLTCCAINAQQVFDVKLWEGGMPNTNGIDSQPEDKSKGNYAPEMRVFLPDSGSATGRMVIACPGGGYSHLSLDNEGYNWAPYFNKLGIAYAVLKYRMPRGNREVPISDAVRAFRLAHEHASQWHINPYDIGIMGFSAGGHLASTIATHTDFDVRPAFQILFYPVISMDAARTHKGSVVGFLGNQRNNQNLIVEFSNEKQIQRHITPPAIIFLSNDDEAVPPITNGLAYYSALQTNSVNASLHIFPSGGHGWGYRSTFVWHQQMLDELTAWLKHLKAPNSNAVKVACIGNSITDGAGIFMNDMNGYPAQLQQLLGSGYLVKNYGRSARTLLRKGDRPYMNEYVWRDCQVFNPDIVIIKLGTNDSKALNWKYKDDFSKDLQAMIDTLKSLPAHPKILLAYPIKAYDDNPHGIQDSVIVNGIIPILKKVAKKNKLSIIDLHTPFEGHREYFQGDGVHPNSKGAGAMAQIIKDAILNLKK